MGLECDVFHPRAHVLLLSLLQSFPDIERGRTRPQNWHVPEELAKK